MPQETHHIPQKKNKQGIFLHNYFKILTDNLFCQDRCLFCVIYNIYAKQTRKLFKNIE